MKLVTIFVDQKDPIFKQRLAIVFGLSIPLLSTSSLFSSRILIANFCLIVFNLCFAKPKSYPNLILIVFAFCYIYFKSNLNLLQFTSKIPQDISHTILLALLVMTIFLTFSCFIQSMSVSVKKPNLYSFSLMAIFGFFVFSLVKYFRMSSYEQLASMLPKYDLVGHFYIIRTMSMCDKSLTACSKNGESNTVDSYVGLEKYPDAFHSFFSYFLHNGFQQQRITLDYLGLFIFATYLLCSSLTLRCFSEIYTFINEKRYIGLVSTGKFFLTTSILLISSFGLSTVSILMGYPNLALALAFWNIAVYLVFFKRPFFAILFLLLISVTWSFAFLILPLAISFIFVKNHLSISKSKKVLLVSLTGLLYLRFFYDSLTSKAYENTFGSSDRIIEPIASVVLFLAIIFYCKGFIRNTINDLIWVVSLVFFPLLIFWIVGLTKGILNSYYLYKSSYFVLSIEFLILFLITCYKIQLRATKRKSKKYVYKKWNKDSLIMMPVIAILGLVWSPTAVFSNTGPFGYWSPLSALEVTFEPSDKDIYSAKSILSAQSNTTSKESVILESGVYWYRDTQWLNALNLSWSDDLQITINTLGSNGRGDIFTSYEKLQLLRLMKISTVCTPQTKIYFDACLKID